MNARRTIGYARAAFASLIGKSRTPILNSPGLSLDLEVHSRTGAILAIGALRTDSGDKLAASGKVTPAALKKLDELAKGAQFVLGHNILKFDLPILRATKPDLHLLLLPVLDTLWLSPLAFPRNPYHHLVKHYKDGGLLRQFINDPMLDAGLAFSLFRDIRSALPERPDDLLTSWHWLCTRQDPRTELALDRVFTEIRGVARPSATEALGAIERQLRSGVCKTRLHGIMSGVEQNRWPMAYAMSWLSVAGGTSVMPPWVRNQFPEAGVLVRNLRDKACHVPDCDWCCTNQNAHRELKRWFGFEDFRPEPKVEDGRSMQQAIVEAALAQDSLLGILPTGTGKSLCYQLPALSRFYKTGALTVVISPLVALMADQVAGLKSRGILSCVTVNGMLSMPERSASLDKVRLGDAGILIISPEQLRSRTIRRILMQREIGAWVLDEAHCLSKWGHAFRPDYRYISRFISERAQADAYLPPIMCLTATARPEVIEDILRHFRNRLGTELRVFNGGSERSNLRFEVVPTSGMEKYSHIAGHIRQELAARTNGGAIVYCATRRHAEDVARNLRARDIEADHFHAGLTPERKRSVQDRFIRGDLFVISATNAFGMGIDKPDVRLVIHADIPGSLENYLQEAGRAGRDGKESRCVLLYAKDDIERQFSMSARSRLARHDIQIILRSLRKLDKRKRLGGRVVATSGEILDEEKGRLELRNTATNDTRVRIGISWLEEAELLRREENAVQVFPFCLQVVSRKEARYRLRSSSLPLEFQKQLLHIVETLIVTDADKGLSTDELMLASGLDALGVRRAMFNLERHGIASNDIRLTAFVHAGVKRASVRRLQEAVTLEKGLVGLMREAAPDLEKGEISILHLRRVSQQLRDEGLPDPRPERLWRLIYGISRDGREQEEDSFGSLSLRKRGAEAVQITLKRRWAQLERTAEIRRTAAQRLLEHFLGRLEKGKRGLDLMVETTVSRLTRAIETDLELKNQVRFPDKLLDCALLWLHEQEILRLNKGLTVFRPAMTIQLGRRTKRNFTVRDFEPLHQHYEGQTLQIHVMKEFAERGLESTRDSLNLARDYFTLSNQSFVARWMPARKKELQLQTTRESWQRIVAELRNPAQEKIVADNRERTNVLVLAGPGSGKTRVLVHRIAYLLRVRRERPGSILALTYNRHASLEIRRRLIDLVGNDSRGVTIMTCHALAMRLVGLSFAGSATRPEERDFREVIRKANAVLKGEDQPEAETDSLRERLLAGFRWILVDEYQDIGFDEYDLISNLAGRTLNADAGKLTLFAVGDDDQNIYAFRGTSVAFIRRFDQDYGPNRSYLVENYRSTAQIISAANLVISGANDRMKSEHEIRVNRLRDRDDAGGSWQKTDPVGRGRVQLLQEARNRIEQAQIVVAELRRLQSCVRDWNWSDCAVIARKWEFLVPVRACCEALGIPVHQGNEQAPGFWQLRETQELIAWSRSGKQKTLDAASLRTWLSSRPRDHWHDLLRQAVDEFAHDMDAGVVSVEQFLEWLAEWGQDARRKQDGLLLSTAHATKGLEFRHVVILDGDWHRGSGDDDPDVNRRLYYVAMTRAQETLALARMKGMINPFHCNLASSSDLLIREPLDLSPPEASLYFDYRTASLRDVDLGFAGRRMKGSPIHARIARLSPGDPLDLTSSTEARVGP